MKEKLLISSCLLGNPCRYDGKSKKKEEVFVLKEKYDLVPICPECMGGLRIPRDPSEIAPGTPKDADIDDIKVYSKNGEDVTAQYRKGAEKALEIAVSCGACKAVLKEKSPSCGNGLIHNGLFDEGLTEGDGVTARLLKSKGIKVFGESQIDRL